MDEIKLHIGCGRHSWSGWVGIDIADYPHVTSKDVYLKDMPDNSADVIYSSHFIAYMDRLEVVDLLAAWHRVLKPGARLQISTPDWDVLRTLPRPLIGPLYGRMEMNGKVIYHKTIYNYDELFQVLRAAGFIKIERWAHVSGMADQSSATYDGKQISLNVNCVKL